MSERFVTPFPLPDEYERELLTILIEECSEVQKRATKFLRFGCDEIQPGQFDTNRKRLSMEIGDLFAVYDLCVEAKLISEFTAHEQVPIKRIKLAKYMQSQRQV